eukprot:scaffold54322_cov74-Phaeocystis_antarctica.AAC.5
MRRRALGVLMFSFAATVALLPDPTTPTPPGMIRVHTTQGMPPPFSQPDWDLLVRFIRSTPTQAYLRASTNMAAAAVGRRTFSGSRYTRCKRMRAATWWRSISAQTSATTRSSWES